MPNGSLCGKALVEMILGDESGAPAEYVSERLVRTGNLPQAYLITKERIDRAKAMESVLIQDGLEKGRWQSGPEALRLV